MTETVIRASSLPSYSDCARRSAARLFKEELESAGFVFRDTPYGAGAAAGTAVHAAAAYTLKEKAKAGRLAPPDAMQDVARDTVVEQSKAGIAFDKTSPDRDTLVAQTTRMAAIYQQNIAPRVQPIAVEERLIADTPFPGLVLSGQSDVLAREVDQLRDIKTGVRRGAYGAQVGAYSLLSRTYGVDVQKLCEDFIKRHTLKKPQIAPESYIHDLSNSETDALAVLRRIYLDLQAYRNGVAELGIAPGDPSCFAANPSSVLCGDKYCPAHGCKGTTAWCRSWTTKETEDE